MQQLFPKKNIENNIEIISVLDDQPDKRIYIGRLKGVSGKFLIKQFIITNYSHYIRLQNEFGKVIRVHETNYIISYHDFHSRDCTKKSHEIMLITKYMPTTLKEEMYILGKKRQFTAESITNILIDVVKGLLELHDEKFQTFHLGIKPSNIVFNKKKNSYAIKDYGINDTIKWLIMKQKMDSPNLIYMCPELIGMIEAEKSVKEDLNMLTFAETTMSKQYTISDFNRFDCYSIGMVGVELLCVLKNIDFNIFRQKIYQSNKPEKELKYLFKLLMDNDTFSLLQILHLMTNHQYKLRYDLKTASSALQGLVKENQKIIAEQQIFPTNRTNVIIVNEIRINTFSDLTKKWKSYSGCRVKNLYVFFYKEKLNDGHAVFLCDKLFQIPNCENIVIDFGGNSSIGDITLNIFFENLVKFQDILLTIWISISVVKSSKLVTMSCMKEIKSVLKNFKKLKKFELLFEKQFI